MSIQSPEGNDFSDSEWFFASARRYPLLSAEEEREIDTLKWQAAEGMQDALVGDLCGRRFIARWAVACRDVPPSMEFFSERENYFLLRRELRDYLTGGKLSKQLAAVVRRFDPDRQADSDAGHISRLDLPANLLAAVAQLLLADTRNVASGTALALAEWQMHWPARGERSDSRPGRQARSLLQRYLTQYRHARERLVNHNLRLVYTVARKHLNPGIPLTDLIQEGTLGLMRAAEKYDHRRGFRFSTYAYNWITQATGRAVADSSSAIRYPTHVREEVNRIHAARAEAMRRGDTPPDDAELARRLGMDEDKLRNLRQLGNLTVSLATPRFADEDGMSLEETLPGGPFGDTDDNAERGSLRRLLLQEIGRLSPAERQVVVSRWGMNGRRPLTRAEVADQLSVSREWVRQLEQSALSKLSENPVIAATGSDYGMQ